MNNVLRTVFSVFGEFSAPTPGAGVDSYSVGRGRTRNWKNASGASGFTVDQLFAGTLGGSPVEIDLRSFTDRLGRAGMTAFSKVRLVWVYAPLANSGNLTVFKSDATNPWNAWLKDLVMRPGAEASFKDESTTGYAVTSGSSQTLKIAGTSGDYYEVFLAGE